MMEKGSKGDGKVDGELHVDSEAWIRRQDVVIWCLINHHLQGEESLAALNWLNWLLTNRDQNPRVCLECSFGTSNLLSGASVYFYTSPDLDCIVCFKYLQCLSLWRVSPFMLFMKHEATLLFVELGMNCHFVRYSNLACRQAQFPDAVRMEQIERVHCALK